MEEKDFAIIVDERLQKLVVPSIWLSKDRKSLLWPPLMDSTKIYKAKIDRVQPGEDWKSFPITKFIKYKDQYLSAVNDVKNNLDEMTDGSDIEKLKSSRHDRKKKNRDSSPTKSSPQKKRHLHVSDSDDSEPEEVNTRIKTLSVTIPRIPKSMSLNKVLAKESDATDTADGIVEPSEDKDAINDGSVSNGKSSLEKDKDDAVPEEWTPMSPEQFQFFVVKFLQNLDKNCTKQFGELNRKVGHLTKKVDKLQTKVESIACTSVTMSNTIDNEVRKYLKPADMDKFQELEDNLKNAKFHNKMVNFLTSLKGLTVNDSVYNIMYASLDDRFAMKFSYHGVKAKDGKPGKDSFVDTQLCSCVYVALQRIHNNPCLDQIKKSLQTWLDQAKNRTNRSNEKSDKPSRKKAFVPIIPEDSENESEAEESI